MAATGIDYIKEMYASGQPINMGTFIQGMPGYQSIADGNLGLKSAYKYNPSSIPGYWQSGNYKQMQTLANSRGPTDVYRDQAKVIDNNVSQGLDQNSSMANSSYLTGMGNLASSGGLDSGARERLASQGAFAKAQGASNIYAGGNRSKAEALANDSQMKVGLLGQLAGWDVNRMNLNTQIQNQGKLFNTQNLINDVRGGNMYNLEGWSKMGDIFGSSEAADAMNKGKPKKWYEKVPDKYSDWRMPDQQSGSLGDWDWLGRQIDQVNPVLRW